MSRRILNEIDKKPAAIEKDLDALFFRAVFLRWQGRCIRCGAEPRRIRKVRIDRISKAETVYEQLQNLTPHHFFCRSYWGTRWEPKNGFLLCYACHIRWAQTRHEEFRDKVLLLLGQDGFDRLKYQAYNGSKPDPFAMKHYLLEKIALYESTISSAAVEVPKFAKLLRNVPRGDIANA